MVGAGGAIRVEVAQSGAARRNGSLAGSADGGRPFELHEFQQHGALVRRWQWGPTVLDEQIRRRYVRPTEEDGERFEVGEWRTEESGALADRWLAVRPVALQAMGLEDISCLRGFRRRLVHGLQHCASGLQELPGVRGRGDYGRDQGIVTNLEFDSTLAWLQLGLVVGDSGLLRRARRSAYHLVDRDTDPVSGLPFPHGPGHRCGTPQPGHAWLTGLLWVALLSADDVLLDATHGTAAALACHPATAREEGDRARDLAWPLWELENYLQVCWRPDIAAVADGLADRLLRRFDASIRTFRFGEGEDEMRPHSYFERAWITAGLVLPALRLHLARRSEPRSRDILRRAEDALWRALRAHPRGEEGAGVATHWRRSGRSVFAAHVAKADPRVVLLMQGLAARDRALLMERCGMVDWVESLVCVDEPWLCTNLSMMARCRWLYASGGG